MLQRIFFSGPRLYIIVIVQTPIEVILTKGIFRAKPVKERKCL